MNSWFFIAPLWDFLKSIDWNQSFSSCMGAGLGAWAAYKLARHQQNMDEYRKYRLDIRKSISIFANNISNLIEQKRLLTKAKFYECLSDMENILENNAAVERGIVITDFLYLDTALNFELNDYSNIFYEKIQNYENFSYFNSILFRSKKFASELRDIYFRTKRESNLNFNRPSDLEVHFQTSATFSKEDLTFIYMKSKALSEYIDIMITILYYDIKPIYESVSKAHSEKTKKPLLVFTVPPEDLEFIPPKP